MWKVVGEYVEIELIGRIEEDQYMAFGISGRNGHSQMVGGDVVVAFYDRKMRRFRAEDYYLSALAQCDGKQGVCPDERIGGRNDAELSKLMDAGIISINVSKNPSVYSFR